MCKRKPAASDGQGSCRTSGEFVAFFAETDWHRELLPKRNPANRSIATTGDFRLLNGSDVCMDLPCSDLSVRSVLISVDVAPNASLLSFELGCFLYVVGSEATRLGCAREMLCFRWLNRVRTRGPDRVGLAHAAVCTPASRGIQASDEVGTIRRAIARRSVLGVF